MRFIGTPSFGPPWPSRITENRKCSRSCEADRPARTNGNVVVCGAESRPLRVACATAAHRGFLHGPGWDGCVTQFLFATGPVLLQQASAAQPNRAVQMTKLFAHEEGWRLSAIRCRSMVQDRVRTAGRNRATAARDRDEPELCRLGFLGIAVWFAAGCSKTVTTQAVSSPIAEHRTSVNSSAPVVTSTWRLEGTEITGHVTWASCVSQRSWTTEERRTVSRRPVPLKQRRFQHRAAHWRGRVSRRFHRAFSEPQ